jgi:hypothetical protein
MKFWKLAICLIGVTLYQPARVLADCFACWELKGVQLQLKDGSALKGYMLWNKAWIQGAPSAPFPKLLLQPAKGAEHIRFHSELRSILYPDSGLIVAVAPERLIPLDSLSDITPAPGEFEGRSGAGSIPVVAERTVKRLQQRAPFAYCKGESEGNAVIYWISYNPEIGAKELRMLCERPWLGLIEWNETLERNLIIRLSFSYD